MEHFRNRTDAGHRLAAALEGVVYERPVVLGLPRGGVPVAAPVARTLGAPLDVLVVRKLGVPGQPEVAMGAIGEQAARVLNDEVIEAADVSPGELRDVERRERAELDTRVARFRGGEPPLLLDGCTAVIVDDGVATGATARVAARVAQARGAAWVVLAIPVGAPESLGSLAADDAVDEIVCLSAPPGFLSVGMYYLDFAQTTDDEVADLLAARRSGG